MISFSLLAAAEAEATAGGWQAVVEGNGIAISLTGMAIVFAALVVISLFIAFVPRVLDWLDPILPKMHSHPAPPAREEQSATDHERIVAAIGMVLHTEMQKHSASNQVK
ncbi:OadG family protein [Aeoliella mucimassa]|uniref:Oxaloacetate decarboxylase, gamma chain n=1 Tax=Aeoliella mucimassa TaxID=2527972 RepID=A0A518AJF4_9BACT|nr:OadG family protein [Aeoliella mucimassa]QDU54804.1 Oxaloacetate decarboxylase, gamma chain [Aeoliella mucimassa]